MEDEQELVKEGEKERLLIMAFSFYVPAPVTLNAVNPMGHARGTSPSTSTGQVFRVKGCMWALMS